MTTTMPFFRLPGGPWIPLRCYSLDHETIRVELSHGSHDKLLAALLSGEWQDGVLRPGDLHRPIEIRYSETFLGKRYRVAKAAVRIRPNEIVTCAFTIAMAPWFGQSPEDEVPDSPHGTTQPFTGCEAEVYWNGEEVRDATAVDIVIDDVGFRACLRKYASGEDASAFLQNRMGLRLRLPDSDGNWLEFEVDGEPCRYQIQNERIWGGRAVVSAEFECIGTLHGIVVRSGAIGQPSVGAT